MRTFFFKIWKIGEGCFDQNISVEIKLKWLILILLGVYALGWWIKWPF